MKRYEYNYGKNPEGALSTISGYATETTNFGETAFGILNKSTRDEENFTTPEVVSSSTATLFSVGNGTDHDSRKNIIELKADGTVYINGVGQYDGTNPGEATDIADEFQGIHDDITGLNEDVDRIDNTIESIHISEDDENLIYTLLVDGQERGTINIPRDQFLKDVSYNEETNNLEFTFIVRGENNEEVEKQVNVNMTDLEDIYSAGDGLNLENKQFSVKVDADTQPYIEVSSNGVKLIGINEALDKKVSWDESKKVITLPADGSISALRNNGLEGGVLVCQRTYDDGATYVTEVGTTKNNLTLNSIERPKIDFADGTSQNIAYESEVKSLQDRMSTAETDIDNLEGRMDTAESDIDTIQSDLSDLMGDGEGSVQDQIKTALEDYLPLSGGTMVGNITFESESAPDTNEHEYVDLGLPSGNLWAKYNVGATSEEEAGLYFQWGDTQGYTAEQVGDGEGLKAFRQTDYKWSVDGSSTNFSKYNASDGKTVLDPEDDAAHVNMGGNWRMPTFEEYKELCFNTDIYLVLPEGEEIQGIVREGSISVLIDFEPGAPGDIKGVKFYKKGDRQTYMFVPASGTASAGEVSGLDQNSSLRTSSLYSSSVESVWYFGFHQQNGYIDFSNRFSGIFVRGVCPKSDSEDYTGSIITVQGKSDQDLLNAAGGTTSISDIIAKVPQPDLSSYATKEEVGSNTYTGANYISKETNLTDAVIQLDEEIKATNDNLALEHANAEATYAKKTELSSYLPLSGGTLTGNLTLDRNLYADGISMFRNLVRIFHGDDSELEVSGNTVSAGTPGVRVLGIGKIHVGYIDGDNLSINKDGITIPNKTTSDLLNAGGSTTPISDIATQIQATIVDSAPETLDTLNELAAALGDDPNFATTVTNLIGTKVDNSKWETIANTNIVTSIDDFSYAEDSIQLNHKFILKNDNGNFSAETHTRKTINAATATTAGVMTAEDKAKLDSLATVATSGSYNDLTDTPTIPTVQSGQTGTNTNYVYSSAADEGYRVLSDISCTRTGDVVKLQGRSWGMPSNSSLDLVTLPLASSSMAGLMSTTDKSKLDQITITDGDIVANGFRIYGGTADEVLTANGDSNTLKTIDGQMLLGSGDVDMSPYFKLNNNNIVVGDTYFSGDVEIHDLHVESGSALQISTQDGKSFINCRGANTDMVTISSDTIVETRYPTFYMTAAQAAAGGAPSYEKVMFSIDRDEDGLTRLSLGDFDVTESGDILPRIDSYITSNGITLYGKNDRDFLVGNGTTVNLNDLADDIVLCKRVSQEISNKLIFQNGLSVTAPPYSTPCINISASLDSNQLFGKIDIPNDEQPVDGVFENGGGISVHNRYGSYYVNIGNKLISFSGNNQDENRGIYIQGKTSSDLLHAAGGTTTLKTINGESLLGSGDVTTPTPTVNAASGTKTIWTGTQSAYEAVATKDANTLYFITEG